MVKLILDPVDLCSTWKRYAQLLFENQREARHPVNREEWSGQEILESEVQHADNGHEEVLNIFDSKHLTYLFNLIYNSDKISTNCLKSTLISNFQKTPPKDCSNYRLKSLIIHALKFFFGLYMVEYTRNMKKRAERHSLAS